LVYNDLDAGYFNTENDSEGLLGITEVEEQQNVLDVTYSIEVPDVAYFDLKQTVYIPITLDTIFHVAWLPTRIDLKSTFRFVKQIDVPFHVEWLPTRVDFESSIYVANRFDLPSHVEWLPTRFDFDSSIYVANRFDWLSHVEWRPTSFDWKSRVYAGHHCDLRTTLKVPDHKTLNVDYTIVMPPFEELRFYPIRDTYTSSANPFSFYGKRPNLITGQYAGGQYRTYIRFDLSAYFAMPETVLRSVELFLTSNSYLPGTVSVYECLSEWNEDFLAWRDNIVLGELVSTAIIGQKTKIDLYSYVQRLKEKGNTSLNLCIISDSYVSFYSRESDQKPYLLLSYFVANWQGQTDASDLLCRIEIPESYELYSTVTPAYGIDLPSTLYVVDPNNPIVKASYLLPSKVRWEPTRYDWISSVTVIDIVTGEFFFYGSVYAIGKGETQTGISVQRYFDSSLRSTVSTNFESSLYSSITVRRTEEKVLKISLNIMHSCDIRGSIHVSDRIDLSSFVNVIQFGEEQLGISTSLMKYYDIKGSVQIERDYDLYSTINVRRTEDLDNRISCFLEKEHLFYGTLSIPAYDYLYSTATIIRTEEVISGISVYRYLPEDLYSKIGLNHEFNLYSTITIRNTDEESIGITCNRYLACDIEGAVTLVYSENIYNKLSITRHNYLYSTLRVVQDNVAELDSTINIATPLICEIYSQVCPICKFYHFFLGKVIINQSAREYKGTTRRVLPREWRQEDFLEERYIPIPPNTIRTRSS